MSRIPLGSKQSFGQSAQAFLQSMPPINLANMIAQAGVVKEVYSLIFTLFDDIYLPFEDREIMLFRTCKNNGCQYEINFHRKTTKMPTQVVDIILSDDVSSLNSWQKTLCIACDEMATSAKMRESSVEAFVEHYETHDIACRAIFFLSWCNLTTMFVDSTGVPVEDDQILNKIKTPEWMESCKQENNLIKSNKER
ncbi:hypothetical protein ACJJID_06985 [Microbulbifer sp. CnH-101-G]|uniref:hypothetical protein n=1 Tax=Microbulbifer sp. CnH-101-G TaxID=3243393 RepID=UPI0040393ECF